MPSSEMIDLLTKTLKITYNELMQVTAPEGAPSDDLSERELMTDIVEAIQRIENQLKDTGPYEQLTRERDAANARITELEAQVKDLRARLEKTSAEKVDALGKVYLYEALDFIRKLSPTEREKIFGKPAAGEAKRKAKA